MILYGPPGHRQDDAGADRRRRRPRRLRGGVGGQRRPRRGAGGDRARRGAPPRHRPADDLLPRRDPPLQQGPAGRAAARGRGGPGDADRGDDREPVLRGQLGAALAQPDLRAARARRRRRSRELLRRALADPERGIADPPEVADEALELLATRSGGDARTALGGARAGGRDGARAGGERSTSRRPRTRCSARRSRYDREGDQHYDYISAWIKATRGSDPDASLYYLAVMLEGGEDPRFIARRMVILASEDVGNADPQALVVATAAGAGGRPRRPARVPLNLAQAAVYLALAPKSNASIPRPRARPRRTSASTARSRRPTTCATPTTRARRSSAAARATSTRTTSRAGSPTSRCCRRSVAGRALLRADRPRLRGRAAERLERAAPRRRARVSGRRR